MSGRESISYSRPEEDSYLIDIFQSYEPYLLNIDSMVNNLKDDSSFSDRFDKIYPQPAAQRVQRNTQKDENLEEPKQTHKIYQKRKKPKETQYSFLKEFDPFVSFPFKVKIENFWLFKLQNEGKSNPRQTEYIID